MAEERWAWQIEEARMFWARGEHNTANYLMRTIIDKLEKVRRRLSVLVDDELHTHLRLPRKHTLSPPLNMLLRESEWTLRLSKMYCEFFLNISQYAALIIAGG